MTGNLSRALLDFVPKMQDHQHKDTDFTVYLDLTMPDGKDYLTVSTVANSDHFNGQVIYNQFAQDSQANPRTQELLMDSTVPKKYEGVKVATEHMVDGMFLIPCFKTVLVFTEDFYNRWKDVNKMKEMNAPTIFSDLEPITTKDWVMLILRMNMIMSSLKSVSIQNLKGGKGGGLASTEKNFLKDSFVPLFIDIDMNKLTASTEFEKFILINLDKANTFVYKTIENMFGVDNIQLENSAYYRGKKIYGREGADAKTIYVPKIELINKGFTLNATFYVEFMKKIRTMSEEELVKTVNSDSALSHSYFRDLGNEDI